MAIHQEAIDFDDMFAKLKETPVIVNDVRFTTEEEKDELFQRFITTYSKDRISTVPSCECGELKGEYQLGVKCPNPACGTVVKSRSMEDIEPILWFRAPQGIEKLISPLFWAMLKKRFTVSSVSAINWICDTRYEQIKYKRATNIPASQANLLKMLESLNIPRGYNNFVQNFDEIMTILFSLKQYRPKNNKQPDFLAELLQKDRHKIFSDHIPLPNKMLVVMEKFKQKSVFDDTGISATDALNMMAGIDVKITDSNIQSRMDKTVRAIDKLSDYYEEFIKIFVMPKAGIMRHHVYSTRSHFSFRAVITSLTTPHAYDEIHIPWGVACGLLKIHIINKLTKLGYDYNDSLGFIHAHVHNHHPLLEKIFTELLAEAPNQRIPTLFNRNPSLLMGSIQLMGITKIKSDPQDTTISVPILSVVPFNADFDGKLHCRH